MAENDEILCDPVTKQVDLESPLLTTPIYVETDIMDKVEHANTAVTLLERYQACMVLGAAGDALGYNCGKWEFCFSGEDIMKEIQRLYEGIANLEPIGSIAFMLSDDTIMHIATAEALTNTWNNEYELLLEIAKQYVECMSDMSGRAPGGTCTSETSVIGAALKSGKYDKEHPPYVTLYDRAKEGCGAAMRSAPIGLLYSHEGQLDQLLKVSIESGRMTHNQSTGFLGSLATALLVHLAIRGVSPLSWGRIILKESNRVYQYCSDHDQNHKDIASISSDWGYFQESWQKYLTKRNLLNTDGPINFQCDYWEENSPHIPSYKNHDNFVTEVSYSGWGGSSGHDAPLIAYDAVLFALGVKEREGIVKAWESLCTFGMFHCGDSDSTGIISGAIWGAMFGFKAHTANYDNIEYKERLLELGEKLYQKSEEILKNDPLISTGSFDSIIQDNTNSHTGKYSLEECTPNVAETEGVLSDLSEVLVENDSLDNKLPEPRETIES